MNTKDKRIDIYIAKSAPFAQPILNHLRQLAHKACPEVEETMKWSFPHFNYNGMMMCSMASFKQHCAFGFWKASIMKDPNKLFSKNMEAAMGHLGKITSLKDLPSDKILLKYIKEAALLNKENTQLPSKNKVTKKKELSIPSYFTTALKKNKKASVIFENFSFSNKKEYIEWVTGAKTEETRNTRLGTAIEWMAEGKIRNWKYIKK